MLEFSSANVRSANPKRAIQESPETALGLQNTGCRRVIVNASIGHKPAIAALYRC